MSTYIDETDASRLTANGAQSQAQRFVVNYFSEMTDEIRNGGMTESFGYKWYGSSMYFYNSNGAVWRGEKVAKVGNELWAPFQHLGHTIEYLLAVPHEADKTIICVYTTRILRFKDQKNVGEIRVPFAARLIVGPEEAKGQGFEGLQFHEIRAFWDPTVLNQWLGPQARVFRNDD
jgi:hypothetical protein